jgi:hypothetical protein
MPQSRSCPIGRFAPARLAFLALAAAIPAAPAGAQYQTGFEPPIYTGSPAGVIITGQDGWILPVAGSVDGLVQTYAGNVAGVRGRAPVGS